MSIAPALRLAPPTRQGLFLAAFAGLCALSWLALAGWHASPYAHYLHTLPVGSGEVCAVPQPVLQAGLYLGGWVLMSAAMMLPSAWPLVAVFLRLTRARPDQGALAGLLVAGYLGVWAAFGALAYGADALVHALTDGSGWWWANGWVVAAGSLAGAGAFQFSALKHRCLDGCRSPLAFAVARWRAVTPRASALRLGLAHGAYCVGCCWALMAMMVAVGLQHLGWMLVLGLLMALEKNMPWGRRLSAPTGLALLAAAALLAAGQLLPA
ncbi:DUF2182 domain-containing protein [Ramlibacter sp. MAHUQ-53]|uniref:DUF2182 domain-containing protein n=1 Tax=unclassified Ramlibacter TaxID=2617605 RepID=UPI003624F88F